MDGRTSNMLKERSYSHKVCLPYKHRHNQPVVLEVRLVVILNRSSNWKRGLSNAFEELLVSQVCSVCGNVENLTSCTIMTCASIHYLNKLHLTDFRQMQIKLLKSHLFSLKSCKNVRELLWYPENLRRDISSLGYSSYQWWCLYFLNQVFFSDTATCIQTKIIIF